MTMTLQMHLNNVYIINRHRTHLWHGSQMKTACSIGHDADATNTILPTVRYTARRHQRMMSEWNDPKPIKKATKRKNPESQHQQALVKWLRLRNIAFCAIPNEGRRSNRNGALMKAMGLTAGVSDIFVAEPRGRFGGYWVELKAPGNIPTQSQYDWLLKMRNKGYRAEWFDHWETAKESIEKYLGHHMA